MGVEGLRMWPSSFNILGPLCSCIPVYNYTSSFVYYHSSLSLATWNFAMSIIMISLQLWHVWLPTGHAQYQMLWPHGCTFHWWCSPLFITYDQPEFTSLRTTFKPTSVHCEERRTNIDARSNKHNSAHSSARDGICPFIWRRTWADQTFDL